MTSTRTGARARHDPGPLGAAVVLVALVVAVVGSLGAPLITAVASEYGVSLAAAQWTLTVSLLTGAVTTPVLGRLGAGPRRRGVVVATLAAVVAGGALTVLPLPFGALLVGRAAQGAGLGLTALMMATARDHLPPQRATGTIAMLSVASTAGIGIGYPVSGLLTDLAGVRAAYGLGLALTVAALAVAVVVIPPAPPREATPLDLPGAVLLTATLLVLLAVVSQTDLWTHHLPVAVGGLGASALLLLGWTVVELRSPTPLVEVQLLRDPGVAAANLAMLTGGVGMYLLLSLVTRYVQTPGTAGYGFELTTFQAGLVLVPFSILGFVAGRLVPALRRRLTAQQVLTAATGVLMVAFAAFIVIRGHLAGAVIVMGILGAGVGVFSAVMPAVILDATPTGETASAMSVNQVVRSVGFSIGSALGGLVLAASTTAGQAFPRPAGYTTAALVGIGVTTATLLVITTARTRHPRPTRAQTP